MINGGSTEGFRHVCQKMIDEMVAMGADKDPATTLHLFNNLAWDETAESFTPNTDLWCNSLRPQLTGIHQDAGAWDQGYVIQPLAGSNRHAISCAHNGPGVQADVQYVNVDGSHAHVPVTQWINDYPGLQGRVSDTQLAYQYDVSVYRYGSDLPAWVHRMPVLYIPPAQLAIMQEMHVPLLCCSQGGPDANLYGPDHAGHPDNHYNNYPDYWTPHNRKMFVNCICGDHVPNVAYQSELAALRHWRSIGDSGCWRCILLDGVLYFYNTITSGNGSGAIVGVPAVRAYTNTMVVRSDVAAGVSNTYQATDADIEVDINYHRVVTSTAKSSKATFGLTASMIAENTGVRWTEPLGDVKETPLPRVTVAYDGRVDFESETNVLTLDAATGEAALSGPLADGREAYVDTGTGDSRLRYRYVLTGDEGNHYSLRIMAPVEQSQDTADQVGELITVVPRVLLAMSGSLTDEEENPVSQPSPFYWWEDDSHWLAYSQEGMEWNPWYLVWDSVGEEFELQHNELAWRTNNSPTSPELGVWVATIGGGVPSFVRTHTPAYELGATVEGLLGNRLCIELVAGTGLDPAPLIETPVFLTRGTVAASKSGLAGRTPEGATLPVIASLIGFEVVCTSGSVSIANAGVNVTLTAGGAFSYVNPVGASCDLLTDPVEITALEDASTIFITCAGKRA